MANTYDLVCPYLDDDPKYAHGVEFGMLFERMRAGEEITNYFLVDNEEQITLLANRLGWSVAKDRCKTIGWVQLTLTPPAGGD